jgi:hypothetical protein
MVNREQQYEDNINKICGNKNYVISYCRFLKAEYVNFLKGRCPILCDYSLKNKNLERLIRGRTTDEK